MSTTRKWGGRRSQRIVKAVLAEYGDRCHICHNRGADSADHILPRSLGGSDDMDNLRPAHLRCNQARGNRIAKRQRQGRDLAGWFELPGYVTPEDGPSNVVQG